jgi:hypothetical protein
MRPSEMRRTVVVLVGGILVASVVPAVLEYFLQPGSPMLVQRVMTTQADSAEWRDIGPAIRSSTTIATLVIAPLVGVAVGAFVGLLQRRHTLLLATFCLLPEFMERLLGDHAKHWATSAIGVARFVAYNSLPFLTGIGAAALCRKLVRRRAENASPAS